jgi:hypothetical protein
MPVIVVVALILVPMAVIPAIFRFGYGNRGLNWLIVWLVVFGVGAPYWLGDPEPKKPEPPPTQIPFKYPFRVR